jgi:hypothetical protein
MFFSPDRPKRDGTDKNPEVSREVGAKTGV